MSLKPPKTGPDQAVVRLDRLPRRFQPEFERDPDGGWLAVIKTGTVNIFANGNTQDEAAGRAIEGLLRVLEEYTLPDFLESVEVEDEEITPETAARIDRARASNQSIPHDDILREFGLRK